MHCNLLSSANLNIVSGNFCKRARAFAYYSSPRIRCIAFWERAVHTFSGLSGKLGSSGLSAHASEFTTERSEVSNYLPIQRWLLRAIYSSLLWPQISIACTRAYVVDDVWDTAIVHIYNEIVFDCAIEKCKTEAFTNISICNWWGIIFRNGRRVHRFILCQNYMMFLLVLNPPPLFWGWILLILRSPKGGCCSISDDLSCSCKFTLIPFAVWSR